MTNSSCLICLGFTEQRFPPGTHICQIFSEDEEREQAFLDFLLRGLQDGERAAGFTDRCDRGQLENHLAGNGISLQERIDSGALVLTGTSDVYFQNGRFELEQMLERLAQFHEESLAQGYSAARVIGEMTPEVEKAPGGERLFEYESRVSLLLREYPVTAVCQYDARQFNGDTIMSILKLHPMMVVRGQVLHNPFFVPPEEYLAGIS